MNPQKKQSQERRAHNRDSSAAMLRRSGVKYRRTTMGGLLVDGPAGVIKFWPATGLFRAGDGTEGRGVRNLIWLITNKSPEQGEE